MRPPSTTSLPKPLHKAIRSQLARFQVKSLPFSGKVILVPLFQPGFTSTVSTSLTRMLCPLASWMVRWIFIFRVLPLYSSSSEHASRCSIGGSLRGPADRHTPGSCGANSCSGAKTCPRCSVAAILTLASSACNRQLLYGPANQSLHCCREDGPGGSLPSPTHRSWHRQSRRRACRPYHRTCRPFRQACRPCRPVCCRTACRRRRHRPGVQAAGFSHPYLNHCRYTRTRRKLINCSKH